jgi:GT2 family glycosyltransferase
MASDEMVRLCTLTPVPLITHGLGHSEFQEFEKHLPRLEIGLRPVRRSLNPKQFLAFRMRGKAILSCLHAAKASPWPTRVRQVFSWRNR